MSDAKRRIKGIEQRLNAKETPKIEILWIDENDNEDGTHTATAETGGNVIWTATRNTQEELQKAIDQHFPDLIRIQWP